MDDALSKLNEDFLSCSICTETFKDPCTINCQHTFCKVCLTKYTKTRREAITAKSILCPTCRQMTRVPRPQEPVDQWCQQFKASFLIQGLLDSFTPEESSEGHCFACKQIGKTTQAKSVCGDCDILFCEACAKIHQATPVTSGHVISPRGTGSTQQLQKRKDMCKVHNCLVEFCCKDCQKAVCQKCCVVNHRKCHSVVTLESMIPEMKQVLQQNSDIMNSHIHQAGNTLKSKRSQMEEITQHKSSLQSEIRRVSQQGVDVIRKKEKKLFDEINSFTEKQTGQLRAQIKAVEIDMQPYQEYTDLIKQVQQSNSPTDLYDMYTRCQSGEIHVPAEILRNEKQDERATKVSFEKLLEVDQLDKSFELGHLKYFEDKAHLQDTPKLLSTVGTEARDDAEFQHPIDIEVLNIGGLDILVVTDFLNGSVKSCYTKGGKPHCTSLKLREIPCRLTKISQDRVVVSHYSHKRIELIKLTPDPILVSSVRTKKEYTCLTTLSDTSLAGGSRDPPSIDVLNLSGRVLRSLITPSTGQQLIQEPWYMCTTRHGYIVVTDKLSGSASCISQEGEVVNTHTLRGYGVTTTDTGSIIVADHHGNKIVQLNERGEFERDLLTEEDGIFKPRGIRVHGDKLYVTEELRDQIKIFQL